MIQLIEDKVILEDDGKDYALMLNECIVDLDAPDKPLETFVYIGNDERGKRCSVITRGEYSCIVASAKTKKSFCKSLITAAYIGGNTSAFSTHIQGDRKTEGYVIDLDTEQGTYYAKKTFSRVEKMVGNRYKNYIPIATRSKSVQERLGLIEWLIYKSPYAGNIDLLLVDGIADLVYNTNDIVEGAKVAEMMLQWTSEGLHICNIIHKAGNNDKARGHLGTAVTIKAESIIFMDRLVDDQGNLLEKNTVKVRCGYVRGVDFEDFYLTVNDKGLPFTHTDPRHNVFKTVGEVKEKEIIPTMSVKDAFGDDDIPF
tara:strand:- start:532 stop:1470 length:939 start_codon:yes stop_codon:yes gene_type:complete